MARERRALRGIISKFRGEFVELPLYNFSRVPRVCVFSTTTHGLEDFLSVINVVAESCARELPLTQEGLLVLLLPAVMIRRSTPSHPGSVWKPLSDISHPRC